MFVAARNSLFGVALCLTCGCADPGPEGLSSFTVSGTAKFTGIATGRIKMALFQTGELLYPGVDEHSAATPVELASTVSDIGILPGVDVAFSLAIDLDPEPLDGEDATLIMWEDRDNDDVLDIGESTSRVLPDLATGCPVFGPPSIVPVHYTYAERPESIADIARGWNQSAATYLPAADQFGATLESEYNFVLLD